MKRNFFLTSVLVLAGLMRPTLAETFPADGYMLEDKTYENAATYTNTGVYEGTVNATAEYTDNIYKIAAGMYLPKESETAAPCTAGYYCPGKADAMYSESGDQGLTKCPAEYPNSAAGAGAQTQCYTACTLATANIAHATGVSGNDYYGDGTDTCVATECELGYHVNESVSLVAKTPVIPVDYTVAGDGATASVNASGIAGYWLFKGNSYSPATSADFDAVLTEPNTWASRYDYGTVYGRASCQPTSNPGFDYFSYKMEDVFAGTMTFEEFESGLAAIIGDGKAAYATNVLREMLSAEEGGDEAEMLAAYESLMQTIWVLLAPEPDSNYSTDSEGQYCYCQTTGYTPTGGNFVEAAAASWVFSNDWGSAADCASYCAQGCARSLRGDDGMPRGFRAAVFGSLGIDFGGTCAANDITINWTDAEEIGDAGMCKYGGDIKTPVKAVTKKGKTFKGWRFEQTN